MLHLYIWLIRDYSNIQMQHWVISLSHSDCFQHNYFEMISTGEITLGAQMTRLSDFWPVYTVGPTTKCLGARSSPVELQMVHFGMLVKYRQRDLYSVRIFKMLYTQGNFLLLKSHFRHCFAGIHYMVACKIGIIFILAALNSLSRLVMKNGLMLVRLDLSSFIHIYTPSIP